MPSALQCQFAQFGLITCSCHLLNILHLRAGWCGQRAAQNGHSQVDLCGPTCGPAAMSAIVALSSTPSSRSTRQGQQQRRASLAAAGAQQRWQRRWQRATNKAAVAMVAQQQPPAAAAAAAAAPPLAEADLSSALSLANIRQASTVAGDTVTFSLCTTGRCSGAPADVQGLPASCQARPVARPACCANPKLLLLLPCRP